MPLDSTWRAPRPLPGLPGLRARLPQRRALRRLIERARVRRRAEAPVSLRGRLIDRAVFALFPRAAAAAGAVWPLALGIRPLALAPRVSARRPARRPARPDPAARRAADARRAALGLRAARLLRPRQRGRRRGAGGPRLRGVGARRPGLLRCACTSTRDARTRPAAGRATIAELRRPRPVVVTAAGCGSAMKEYGELLGTDEARGSRAGCATSASCWPSWRHRRRSPAGRSGSSTRTPATCATPRASADQPRELLRAVPGLELIEIEDADLCCGSAGIYNLTQPQRGGRARSAQGACDPGGSAGRDRHRQPRLRAPAGGLAAAARPGRPADRASGAAAGLLVISSRKAMAANTTRPPHQCRSPGTPLSKATASTVTREVRTPPPITRIASFPPLISIDLRTIPKRSSSQISVPAAAERGGQRVVAAVRHLGHDLDRTLQFDLVEVITRVAC